MVVTIDIYEHNDPENMFGTACLWLLFYSDILWPDLDIDLLSMAFVLMLYTSQTFNSTLGEFEHFRVRLIDPRIQNVKTLHFYLGPDLGLTYDLNHKMLNMD